MAPPNHKAVLRQKVKAFYRKERILSNRIHSVNVLLDTISSKAPNPSPVRSRVSFYSDTRYSLDLRMSTIYKKIHVADCEDTWTYPPEEIAADLKSVCVEIDAFRRDVEKEFQIERDWDPSGLLRGNVTGDPDDFVVGGASKPEAGKDKSSSAVSDRNVMGDPDDSVVGGANKPEDGKDKSSSAVDSRIKPNVTAAKAGRKDFGCQVN